MADNNPKPSRLSARVAPFRDAIAAARLAGFTWPDLARALATTNPTSLRRAWARCGRYQADQVPLPTTPTEKRPTMPVQANTSNGEPTLINKHLIK
jgi:hypothetical protein